MFVEGGKLQVKAAGVMQEAAVCLGSEGGGLAKLLGVVIARRRTAQGEG